MALFQTSVLNKYLSEQDKELVTKQYSTFKEYFLNTTIQENIIASKEEEFQEGFLRELFVKVLGYTINPEPNFNLITELKNEKDSKKADGAIKDGDKVLAVIELKSTKTTDFNKIEIQAFGYKNNQANCRYVITSNFQKIRFYIDNAIEFLEWDLFKLDIENFKLLFLCLHKDSIFKNIPATIKTESVTVEENVTKQLYKEYSQFRKSLFNNIVELNPTIDKLLVFKKTQKLLDRFLFLFFAEDRMLVPPNSVRLILDQWSNLKDMDAYQRLYDRFKLYFGYLNTGHKGKLHDIFAYNGGLFAPDEILDSIKIDDAILQNATLGLSNYDYNSEVDVNILGHIFEHSLTEIEELEKEITTVDSTMEHAPLPSKRKKDGVFYTPKYITKYIVENTVGTLCKNKKKDLKLQEEDYHKLTKKAKKQLFETLLQYKEWLLHITIIDPACGSGAFLNQALEFLIAEHKWISELEANITNSSIVFDIETTILENNIFGVDINEESVEIAKLSLWLRTARKGRKLNSLNNNIKCGNSLIDDVNIAGDKAFNWQEQFPQIFIKKEKKAYHITTALHDSRTSQRMVDYNVRALRDQGNNPYSNVKYLNIEEEILIINIVNEIAEADKLNIMAFNVCRDHMHIVLVCNEDELSKIIQKIKAKTARAVNIKRGVTIPSTPTMEHAPLPLENSAPLSLENSAPLSLEKDAPLPRGEKQNSLWTQKYGCKEIKSDEQLWNTIEYVKNNRIKHELPPLPLSSQQWSMLHCLSTNYDIAFAKEYKGGFDVVIGNPPYVQISENKQYYDSKYLTSKSNDLYALFYEKGNSINKLNGYFGFITPSLFIKGIQYESLRDLLIQKFDILILDDLGDGVFNNVNMPTAILIAKNSINENQNWNNFIGSNDLINKIDLDCIFLGEITSIMRGLEIGKDKTFDKGDVPIITGEDCFRFGYKKDLFISFKTHEEYKKKAEFFNQERIVIRETGNRITSFFISETIEQNRSLYSVIKTNKEYSYYYLLGLINSELLQFYYKTKFASNTDVFPKIRIVQCKQLPIKIATQIEQKSIIEKVEIMLLKNKEIQKANSQFQKLLSSKFDTLNINTKLEKWYTLSFADFSKELTKQKIKLSLSQESEWLTFFEEEKQKALVIKNQIDKTDKEIDNMVYALYGLTDEEIVIVEKQ